MLGGRGGVRSFRVLHWAGKLQPDQQAEMGGVENVYMLWPLTAIQCI